MNSSIRFHLAHDGGFAEWFQYAKQLSSGVLLFVAARRERSSLLTLWAVVCWYLFLDDALRLHEQIGGERLARQLTHSIVPAKDFGQLIFASFLAVIILAFAASLWRAASVRVRRVSMGFLVCLSLLGLMAVVVDFFLNDLWLMTLRSESGRIWLPTLEEGGELVAMSLILWWSARSAVVLASASHGTGQPLRVRIRRELSVPVERNGVRPKDNRSLPRAARGGR